MATNQEKIKQLIELRKTAQLGGGEKAIAKQHEKGKYTARERINMLLEILFGRMTRIQEKRR